MTSAIPLVPGRAPSLLRGQDLAPALKFWNPICLSETSDLLCIQKSASLPLVGNDYGKRIDSM